MFINIIGLNKIHRFRRGQFQSVETYAQTFAIQPSVGHYRRPVMQEMLPQTRILCRSNNYISSEVCNRFG